MSDTDRCGAETASGDGCRHPTTDDGDPDRCWIDAHNDASTSSAPGGRPPKFNDELARKAVTAAKSGKSIKGCGRAAGVAGETIRDWRDDHEKTYTDSSGNTRQFSVAFRRARAEGESNWISAGEHIDDVNARSSSFAKFMLASSYDYKKTEKTEVTGGGGGPVEINVNETVVETTDYERE